MQIEYSDDGRPSNWIQCNQSSRHRYSFVFMLCSVFFRLQSGLSISLALDCKYTNMCWLNGACQVSSTSVTKLKHFYERFHKKKKTKKKSACPFNRLKQKNDFSTQDSASAIMQVFVAIERFLSASQTTQISIFTPLLFIARH